MRKFLLRILSAAVLGIALAAPSANALDAANALHVLSQGDGTLHRSDPTEQFVVHSGLANQDFLIQVTPPGSEPWLPGQKAAVAYVLDGGFGIVAPAARYVGGTRAMLPAYIVTIAYAPDKRGSRERDMLFTSATRPDGSVADSGGGEAFMAFLVDELRPFIEARYPVDSAKSVLVGDSLAGIFTANVLARRPEAFAGYLIGSPSVWADPDIVDRLATVSLKGTARRVFVGYGGAEVPYMVRGARQLGRTVGRNRAFTSRVQVLPDADHRSVFPELMAKGLSYLLPQNQDIRYPDPIRLTADTLRRYEGTYILSDGRSIEVSLEADRLTATLASPVELYPTTVSGCFLVEGYNARLTFEGRKGEAPRLLRIELNGDEAIAHRKP